MATQCLYFFNAQISVIFFRFLHLQILRHLWLLAALEHIYESLDVL
jgi:hypothetical protein